MQKIQTSLIKIKNKKLSKKFSELKIFLKKEILDFTPFIDLIDLIFINKHFRKLKRFFPEFEIYRIMKSYQKYSIDLSEESINELINEWQDYKVSKHRIKDLSIFIIIQTDYLKNNFRKLKKEDFPLLIKAINYPKSSLEIINLRNKIDFRYFEDFTKLLLSLKCHTTLKELYLDKIDLGNNFEEISCLNEFISDNKNIRLLSLFNNKTIFSKKNPDY